MAWTRNSTSGVLTHSGTAREVWNPGTSVPAMARIYADCSTTAHAIGIMVPMTQDGRTGLRCGIDPSDTTKVMIRRVTFGVEAANLDDDAHGIPAGIPFRLQVEIIGNVISVSTIASGYATVTVSYTNATAPTYSEFSNWGLVSAVNGATVLAASIMELRAVLAEVSEVLVGVANGSVYLAFDEDTIALANNGAGAFSPSADVSLTVLDGVVYGVDGTKAKKINVLTRTVLDWGPDDIGSNWDITVNGALPGAEEVTGDADARKPGTTTARVARAHKGRIYLAGMDESPHALYACAVLEPQMWYTGELAEGRAFALGVDRKPGASYTILSLKSVSDNVLLIGCSRAIQLLVGDPVDGFPEIVEVASDVGISGLSAVTTGIEGVNIAHSPDAGLLLVPVSGAPVPVSAGVLTELIQFPRGDRQAYAVTLVRDTQRHGLHIFLTLRESTGSVHLWYDEKIGGYQPGAGGFFPEDFPDDCDPICAVNWRGSVIMGGKTGYLWKFGTTAADNGAGITTRMPLSLMNDDGVIGDTVLSYFKAELSDSSDAVTCRIFGGNTVEGAYSLAHREQLFSRSLTAFSAPIIHRLRSRALVAEFSSTAAGTEWRLEAVAAEVSKTAMLRRSRATTIAAAAGKCEPFVATDPPEPPDPDPSPGPGAGGSRRVPSIPPSMVVPDFWIEPPGPPVPPPSPVPMFATPIVTVDPPNGGGGPPPPPPPPGPFTATASAASSGITINDF